MDVAEVAADLVAEQQALDEVVADLDTEAWSRATPIRSSTMARKWSGSTIAVAAASSK